MTTGERSCTGCYRADDPDVGRLSPAPSAAGGTPGIASAGWSDSHAAARTAADQSRCDDLRMALLQRCNVADCPNVQVASYCAEHAGTITAHDRSGTRPKRRPRASVASGGDGYDRTWMRLRARKLKRDPICEWPECEREAEHVHHIDGLGCRGPRGYDMGNLMSLCAAHHNPISAQQRWAGEPVQLPRRRRLLSF
jgi:hypothetical protein